MKDNLIRTLAAADWEQICAIYAEGIATGNATFETATPDWVAWDNGHLPVARLVAVTGETVAGWAALSPVSRRECYRGVADVSVYVGKDHRGNGLGAALMRALIAASEVNGIWTLQAGIFPENEASLRLHLTNGFREVGRRERIGKHNGVWRDTLLLERRSIVAGIG
ncbi:MAG: N-acetyltransferase family protein [Pyrinomonadaceae bacterium]